MRLYIPQRAIVFAPRQIWVMRCKGGFDTAVSCKTGVAIAISWHVNRGIMGLRLINSDKNTQGAALLI